MASAAPADHHGETRRRSGLTSVIIVAADSGAGLLEAVGHVLASTVDVEAIVVDNASSDGSVDAAAARWTGDARVRIVRNPNNLGFGAGCNRGAAAANGDALLFLNPDCLVAPDVVARLRAAATDGIGLLGVAIVDGAGSTEPASRRRDPTLRRTLMTLSGLAHWQSRWPALAGVDLAPARPAAPIEDVDAISGALMFMPRSVFDAVGGFDEGYFLHAEDLDLCRRVRDAGYRVACANTIEVAHAKGGSSRHRPLFVSWHKHRGLWRWFTKFDPAARNPLLRGVVWAGLWVRFALLAPVAALRQQFASRQR